MLSSFELYPRWVPLKIVHENAFEQKKKKPGLNLIPG